MRGAWFVRMFGGVGYPKGIPDILCAYGGRFWGIECKSSTGRLTLHQRQALQDIIRNGGIGVVVADPDLFEAFLSSFDPGEKYESIVKFF